MKPIQRIEKSFGYLALAFAMPFLGILFVMIIGQYSPFGSDTLFDFDSYHQYYPFLVNFRSSLLEGKSLLYTWNIGLGMEYLGLASYYLTSPLYLLSIFVPESLLLEYFSLLLPIKLGFSGFCFAVFLRKVFDKNDLSIAIFGGFYALCAWVLGYHEHIMWLDTFAILPLMVLGTLDLLGKRKCVLYTVMLFLSILFNYYIGLFVCFFIFLLFFIYEFNCWGGWRKYSLDFLRIAVYSVVAIGMTAILELPALWMMLHSLAAGGEFPTDFYLTFCDGDSFIELLGALRLVMGNMGGAIKPTFSLGLPNVSCGIISILLMILYLSAKKIQLREKISAVLLLLFFALSFSIRQLDYIWHGFRYTAGMPFRFSFLYSFVVLYMAYRAWTLRNDFTIKQILLSGILTAGVIGCYNGETYTVSLELGSMTLEVTLHFIYNALFLTSYLLAMLMRCIQKKVPEIVKKDRSQLVEKGQSYTNDCSEKIIQTLMVVELLAILLCFGTYYKDEGVNIADYPKSEKHADSVISYMLEREKEDLFYRAETALVQTSNDGALNGYNGVSGYSSTANRRTLMFMDTLGYGAHVCLYNYEDSSPVANLFLSLKYMIERDGKDRSSSFFAKVYGEGNVTLLENQAYLPLAFMTDSDLAFLKFDYSSDIFVFQNQLFKAATGIEENVWNHILADNVTISGENMVINYQDENGYCMYDDAHDDSSVIYRYVADRDGFMCLYINLSDLSECTVKINGVETYRKVIGTHGIFAVAQMVAVGDVAVGDVIELRIPCNTAKHGEMNIAAVILKHDVFWEGYEILNTSTLEITTFEDTYIKGKIQCDRDGLLYASIPQNGNWKLKVDGEPAEIQLVGDCMVGVMLTKGQHLVEYIYCNQIFDIAWKISLLCVAIFGVLVFKQSRHKKR